MNCYECDTLLEQNWNYCPNCKRKIKKHKNVKEEDFVNCNEVGRCHTCSCELNDSWNFCPVCGTSAEFYSTKPNVGLPTMATNTDSKPMIVPVESTSVVDKQVKGEDVQTTGSSSKVYCTKCGAVVTEDHSFCARCGRALKQNLNVQNNQPEQNVQDKSYVILIILSYVIFPMSFFSFENKYFFTITSVSYLVSLFLIIFARIRYSKSLVVKVFFWLFILGSVFGILLFGVILVFSVWACAMCFENY